MDSRKQAASRPRPPFPKPGVDLAFHDVVQADAEAGQHLAAKLLQAQVRQVIAQQAPHQPFHRDVVQPLGVLVAIARLGLQHAVHDAVANGQRHRLQIISRRQLRHRANERVPDVPQDGLTQNLRRRLRKKRRGCRGKIEPVRLGPCPSGRAGGGGWSQSVCYWPRHVRLPADTSWS